MSNTVVLCPRIPSDFLGSTVGSCEDLLLSLFIFALRIAEHGTKCLVVLDGLDQILGVPGNDHKSSSTNNISDVAVANRMRSMFVNIIDHIKRDYASNKIVQSNLLIICTARSDDERYSDRFDKQFYLSDPDYEERHGIVQQCLGIKNTLDEKINDIMAAVATSLMGKSRGEIALCCREAMTYIPMEKAHGYDDDSCITEMKLEFLQKSMQKVTPESLKQLSSDELIEMRVFSSNMLQSYIDFDNDGKIKIPLLGENAQEAWRQMKNVFIAPLCQWQELDEILYGSVTNKDIFAKKGITCGVLISGDPGVGKTALAYHCAAVAARFDPTIRLIDVSCTSLVSKEVGSSEVNITRLFKTARSASPCIILLDGIENIAPVRGHDNTTEGTMDRLLSTLLTEMDGVMSIPDDGPIKGIAVIGITHNPTWIDPALLRPGRLEKCIHLDFPDNIARTEIFKREIMDVDINFSSATYFEPKDKNQLSEYISIKTPGKSAAEIIAISKDARMSAIRDAMNGNEVDVTVKHFIQAVQKDIML